ncbi:cell division protein FtsQ/DivIB [Pontimicrobium aquaticum]|uniref:cell division protein FtsQ/DivIB n=1 Tax=Pontimicrobium aquaticum TaxID=2565367 RepID=UPI001EEFDCB0|nr:cell division protein FtsQ/DivIB [Pontimicrobium aquaticum]
MSFVFVFSSFRNRERRIEDIKVNFLGDNNLFMTEASVNKLLIQKVNSLSNMTKEILDLNELENVLKSNPMIKTAEVHLTVNGEVRADVLQRKPIARVSTNVSYYIDDEGTFMPLSTFHSARVPLVTGHVKKNKLEKVYKLAEKVFNDAFLKMHVVEIHQKENETFVLKTRAFDFEIWLGNLDNLEKKINNLKAFYQKAKKDNELTNYSIVNLQFDNQVVCTKK